MLPKKYRITFTRFNQIPLPYKEIKTAFLNIKIKNSTNTYPRFAVTVPKALDKRSSVRHKTKRMILEIIYKNIKNIKTPTDMLVKPRRIIKKHEAKILESEIHFLIQKANNP